MRSDLGLRRLPALALVALLGLAALPAAAQDAPTSEDLRALRFYIEQGETAAIAAELRRLRIEFPDWTPPDDLSQLQAAETAPGSEIDDIYARIARGDLAGARRLIGETRSAYPSWTPPDDMISLLETEEAAVRFDEAIEAGDPAAALRIALDTPELVRCNRIDNPWRLAELQESTGNEAAALTTYRQIVASCSAPGDLIATIEKANSVASVDELNALVDTASARAPGAASRFEDLRRRLLAGRGIAPADDGEAEEETQPQRSAAEEPASRPERPAQAARPSPAPAPAREETPAPEPVASGGVVPGTPAVSPLASLSLRGDGRLGAVRAAAQSANFRLCAARSVRPASIEVAYERAWCVYNLERPLEALALFSAAAQSNLGGTVRRDARYGMALSYLKREMTDAASEIAASTDLTLEQRQTVEGIILDQRGVRAYRQEEYRRAIVYFDGLEELEGTLRRDLALLRAYAYLNSGDVGTARAEFRRLHEELATEETRAGLAAARFR